MTEQETFFVVNESGDILDHITGPHVYPYPFNQAVARAQKFAEQHGNVLFIDDANGRRWGRLERISAWCWSYCPVEVTQ